MTLIPFLFGFVLFDDGQDGEPVLAEGFPRVQRREVPVHAPVLLAHEKAVVFHRALDTRLPTLQRVLVAGQPDQVAHLVVQATKDPDGFVDLVTHCDREVYRVGSYVLLVRVPSPVEPAKLQPGIVITNGEVVEELGEQGDLGLHHLLLQLLSGKQGFHLIRIQITRFPENSFRFGWRRFDSLLFVPLLMVG